MDDSIMDAYMTIIIRTFNGEFDRTWVLKAMKWIAFESKTESDGSNSEAEQIIKHLLHGEPLPEYINQGILSIDIENDDNDVWCEQFQTMLS